MFALYPFLYCQNWHFRHHTRDPRYQSAEDLVRAVGKNTGESCGCIKTVLKAWKKTLHIALTGVTSRQTLANFEWLAKRACKRPELPLLIASTLMVPGYIDAREISFIAGLIAKLGPTIPHSLLGFHPDYRMTDLPPTSREQALECVAAARQAGLLRVKVGNVHGIS